MAEVEETETGNLNVWESQHFDPKPEDVLSPDVRQRIAVIRTSDRILFKRCRRRWGWQSHLRANLSSKETAGPLWFGSGVHYALEDFHGYRVYSKPSEAFVAYYNATSRAKQPLPFDHPELKPLGIGMMDYYSDLWLKQRDPLETFIFNGIPQVEVNAQVEIPIDQLPPHIRVLYDRIIYSATLDRVVEIAGELWIVEYKTAKRIATMHYQTDPQVGAYCWIGNCLYGRPIAGVMYQQHRKSLPEAPRILATGKVSTDKRMATTHRHYRAVLANLFGPQLNKCPGINVEFLNWLATEEDEDKDHFIRRDRIERNESSHQTEGVKILLELEDMLNPDLPLYPNPIRECAYQCSFLGTCVSMDDGGDWEHELETLYTDRPKEREGWRQHLRLPNQQPQHQAFQ
jgi:hypothetical protein